PCWRFPATIPDRSVVAKVHLHLDTSEARPSSFGNLPRCARAADVSLAESEATQPCLPQPNHYLDPNKMVNRQRERKDHSVVEVCRDTQPLLERPDRGICDRLLRDRLAPERQ